MPRQRQLVTEKLDPVDLHNSAISRAIKTNKPFTVEDATLIAECPYLYAVLYQAPKGGVKRIFAYRNTHANAIALRNMLNEAWAEGYWSSGQK